MSKIEQLLAGFADAASSPRRVAEEYKRETGGKVVGCMPPYCPEEIVHAAGMLPVGMWGGQTELNVARTALPAFACSIMQSVTEFQLKGVYDCLDAVLAPSSCDTLKAIGQKWNRPGIPCIQFVHPHNRRLDAARDYLRAEYRAIVEKLETVCGAPITEKALQRSIAVYDEHRRAMREFTRVAAKYPHSMNPLARHNVMKSAFFMRKDRHTALVRELTAELMRQEALPWSGLRAVVSGIMLEPVQVIELFRELNIAVVADDLAQESRQYRVDTPAGADALDRMAGRWQQMYGCSLAFETDKRRGSMLRQMKEESGADAVIICMMKFCDPEEFDYPIIKRELEDAGIPLLQIEIDQQVQFVEQIRTRLQSFAEILTERQLSRH